MAKKKYAPAVADFTAALALDPHDAIAFHERGLAWFHTGEYAKAIADLNEAIQTDPKLSAAFNSRAWLWATCPDAKFRDGKCAVESALRACELSQWKNARYLDTLASRMQRRANLTRP